MRSEAVKNKILYKSIFLYSSLQSVGFIEEYLSRHAEKLVAFLLEGRLNNTGNLIRLYKKGKLVDEKNVKVSRNIVLYYIMWYYYQLYILIRYFSPGEKVVVITFHPISFFGMWLQKKLRDIDFLFWDGDYFPPINWSLILFEKLKRHYNSKVKYAFYQSDLLNKLMNDRIVKRQDRKTVMWGVKPKKIQRKMNRSFFTILFVGVIRDSQGIEFLFEFLKNHKDYALKLIGMSTENLYDRYEAVIRKLNIESQVYFPNRFFSDKKLEDISKTCQVGIALYDISPTNGTYYTDPGKVKTYASLGLPIIMSDTSAIAPYIKKFDCGILIQQNIKELGMALLEMKKNYEEYLKGLDKFNTYFYYETYYRSAFDFLEIPTRTND